jgi:hypothetical protein
MSSQCELPPHHLLNNNVRQVFPLAEDPPAHVMEQMPSARVMKSGHPLQDGFYVAAFSTKRMVAPKKGQWFLSGAEIEAYMAAEDMQDARVIARLCFVRVSHIPRCTLMQAL